MIKVIDEDFYIPMKDCKKWIKDREDYLKSIDRKYGTGLAIRNWRSEGKQHERHRV